MYRRSVLKCGFMLGFSSVFTSRAYADIGLPVSSDLVGLVRTMEGVVVGHRGPNIDILYHPACSALEPLWHNLQQFKNDCIVTWRPFAGGAKIFASSVEEVLETKTEDALQRFFTMSDLLPAKDDTPLSLAQDKLFDVVRKRYIREIGRSVASPSLFTLTGGGRGRLVRGTPNREDLMSMLAFLER